MADGFDEAEFLRVLERVAADQPELWADPKPKLDRQLRRDVRDEAIHGGKIERYVKALEAAGLVLVPPQAMGTWSNGQPHEEAMWIHPDFDLQIAFTEDDVLTLFKGDEGPRELYEWVTNQQRRMAARKAGLVLPG